MIESSPTTLFSAAIARDGRAFALAPRLQRAVAELIEQALRAGLPVERVVLFGSRARGTPRPDSDVDVAFELGGERSRSLERQLSELADEVETVSGLLDLGIALQAVPLFADRAAVGYDPLRRAVEADGIELWRSN